VTDAHLQILEYTGGAAAVIALAFVLRWRRRGHHEFLQKFAATEVCPHLKPAFDLLLSRGHTVVRAGQADQEYPLELHLTPKWDPEALLEELKLEPPVYLSQRNVLFCKECMCELHPV
jgi:hypothetical protein